MSIKIDNTSVFNIARAVYSARNAMNSWDKSDSDLKNDILGENDLKLAQSLAHNGSDHRKFLRQIMVSVDITAPRYWWVEADTYKIGTTSNSCSTMHTIHKRDLTLDDFSTDGLNVISIAQLEAWIKFLNATRIIYTETKDKTYWRNLIMLLPQNFNQMRTVTLNYEVLLNQYHARKQHKLSEWLDYCEWIKTLPYAEELICSVG